MNHGGHGALGVLLLALATLVSVSATRASARTDRADRNVRPAQATLNVVLITVDTLRADHLGCYGYRQIKTPNIDALAAEGMRFERAFAVVPVTLPSHATMLTGTYPMLSGMHDFSANKLSATQPTLASVLKQSGYATGAVIGAAVLDSRFGLNQGFDFYYDHFDFSRLNETNLDEMERPGNVVADVTLDWLGKNWEKKFFLWMHLYDPHFPYTPPEPYRTAYAGRLYDGEIAFADAQIGRLVRFLKEKGIYRNTVIVLAGDHGEGLGEHGEKTHGFFIYNSTMHVPLIVSLPDHRLPGAARVIAEPVSLVDAMPTILEAVGVEIPATVQGKSLMERVRGGEAVASARDRTVYGETFLPRIHFNWSELRAAENAKYHLIDAPKPELYDVGTDPGETHNLLGEKKAVSEEMRAKLTAMIREYSAGKELAEKTGLDPALVERLKSLGYAAFSGGSGPDSNPTISGRNLPDPKDRIEAYENFSDAMAASQHGRFEESNEELKTVLKAEPNSIPAHYLAGLNYYRLHKYDLAVAELRKTVELSPDYALAAFNLGMAQAHAGQIDAAIATLRRALELDGTNFEAAYNLGVAYIQKRDLEQAAEALRKSVAANPEFARGHRALGETLFYQGKLDEALTELRRAAELAPEEPQMHESLAKALEAKGLTAEAEEERRRAQKAGPR